MSISTTHAHFIAQASGLHSKQVIVDDDGTRAPAVQGGLAFYEGRVFNRVNEEDVPETTLTGRAVHPPTHWVDPHDSFNFALPDEDAVSRPAGGVEDVCICASPKRQRASAPGAWEAAQLARSVTHYKHGNCVGRSLDQDYHGVVSNSAHAAVVASHDGVPPEIGHTRGLLAATEKAVRDGQVRTDNLKPALRHPKARFERALQCFDTLGKLDPKGQAAIATSAAKNQYALENVAEHQDASLRQVAGETHQYNRRRKLYYGLYVADAVLTAYDHAAGGSQPPEYHLLSTVRSAEPKDTPARHRYAAAGPAPHTTDPGLSHKKKVPTFPLVVGGALALALFV